MSEQKIEKTILFSGGGTGGSVTPLLAVAEELLKNDLSINLIFVGTPDGPEKEMVAAFNSRVGVMEFIALASGKWRRYFSFANFFDIFKIILAWFKSFIILGRTQPDLLISAGSFISVPLVWAAALKRIPVLIHQQDVRPGLANRLMAPLARVVTVTFEKSLLDYGPRAVWLGNPVKDGHLISGERRQEIKIKYNLNPTRPLVLVTGGGTGSASINKLIFKASPELTKFCQVIHQTGKGKLPAPGLKIDYYKLKEFLNNEELLTLMVLADLVISRAGLAVLTELSALSKPAILIPIRDSHQEDNATVFSVARAAVVLNQDELTPEKLVAEVKRVLNDNSLREELSKNISYVIKRGGAEKMASIIEEILGK